MNIRKSIQEDKHVNNSTSRINEICLLAEMQANYHHMADEKLSLTEGNGEFTKKETFVLGMGKEKDFDRRVRLAEKNEMRKRIKSRKYFAFWWNTRSLMFLEFCLVGGTKCKKVWHRLWRPLSVIL